MRLNYIARVKIPDWQAWLIAARGSALRNIPCLVRCFVIFKFFLWLRGRCHLHYNTGCIVQSMSASIAEDLRACYLNTEVEKAKRHLCAHVHSQPLPTVGPRWLQVARWGWMGGLGCSPDSSPKHSTVHVLGWASTRQDSLCRTKPSQAHNQ